MNVHLTTPRDLLVLLLTFNAFHMTLNIGGDQMNTAHVEHCPYASWYASSVSLLLFGASAAAIVANVYEWSHERTLSLAVDALALPMGMFWLATTKPHGWYASASVPGCDMFEVPWAYTLFLLGEILTFGSAVRLAALAYTSNMPRLSAGIVVFGSFSVSGLMWIMANLLRSAYDISA